MFSEVRGEERGEEGEEIQRNLMTYRNLKADAGTVTKTKNKEKKMRVPKASVRHPKCGKTLFKREEEKMCLILCFKASVRCQNRSVFFENLVVLV